jgi:tubulin polyglutamylase TTLL9
MLIHSSTHAYTHVQVWLYRGGFCRFTTYRYSNASSDISNTYMHLTNVAIQVRECVIIYVCVSLGATSFHLMSVHASHIWMLVSVQYEQRKSELYDEAQGGKWDLRDLKLHLISVHGTCVFKPLIYV